MIQTKQKHQPKGLKSLNQTFKTQQGERTIKETSRQSCRNSTRPDDEHIQLYREI